MTIQIVIVYLKVVRPMYDDSFSVVFTKDLGRIYQKMLHMVFLITKRKRLSKHKSQYVKIQSNVCW